MKKNCIKNKLNIKIRDEFGTPLTKFKGTSKEFNKLWKKISKKLE